MKENQELFREIGMRIKKARKAAGLTQEKLADKIDKSVQFISDMERGIVGPSIPTLIEICKVLYVSSDFLLLARENPTTHSCNLDTFSRVQYLSDKQKNYIDQLINLSLEMMK